MLKWLLVSDIDELLAIVAKQRLAQSFLHERSPKLSESVDPQKSMRIVVDGRIDKLRDYVRLPQRLWHFAKSAIHSASIAEAKKKDRLEAQECLAYRKATT